ncbi:MAG: DUF1926 domain-containing protein [Treponema sp.]|nr:DUF1926 domain-containing protein [Treponema sp.]
MSVNVSFILDLHETDLLDTDRLNNLYESGLKPLLTLLYAHPRLLMGISVSGPMLSYYKEHYPEAIQILGELTNRHQVEILSNGYYSPIFPLLFPIDRSAQIETLNTLMRDTVGKRPRGLSLFSSIWDPSLVTTFQSCGIEYVLLDKSLVPQSKNSFLPIISSEQGKNIKILTVHNDLLPQHGENGNQWSVRVIKSLPENFEEARSLIVCLKLTLENFVSVREDPGFHSFIDYIESENTLIQLTIPQSYLKNARHFIPYYIPAGMHEKLSDRTSVQFANQHNSSQFPYTIHDYLNTYVQTRHLYERMMYISMLISSCHGGDKMRKKLAQEKLWEAQAGDNFVSYNTALPSVAAKRQQAYKLLNEAERYIRESKSQNESITSFDYNGDGLNEYVCQMEKFNAVVSQNGGQIVDLNLLYAGANPASSLSRIERFDGVNDFYNRGFFVDHLLEYDQFDSFLQNKNIPNTLFPTCNYEEKRFDNKRREIQLEAHGNFSSMKLLVSLKKNFNFSSNGVSVQYILKNESPFSLKGIFVVELNLTQTHFEKDMNYTQYEVELIVDSTKKAVDENSVFKIDSGLSLLQISDKADKQLFLFEPNEESGFVTSNIAFRRDVGGSETEVISNTRCAQFWWNVDLAADRAMEKTINLSIIPSKKS